MLSERFVSMRPLAACAAVLLTAACATARPSPAPAPQPAAPEPDVVWEEPPVVQAEIEAPARDILGSVDYDLPVEANSWVEAELDFLVGQRAEVIRSWLSRGDYYEPYIKQVLRDHGIPTDLYHLAAIESGFVPTARSHAGAVGMWQFMPSTGRGMGLRIDAEVDERMDPVRSTRAAARHLRSLYRSLGDWALSAAAYNAGSGRITRGMSRFGATNFWELAQFGDLAEETRRYVPRLFAVTVIGRDRERFGVGTSAPPERFAYDSIQVEYAVPLAEIARLGEAPEDALRRLNPHLLRGTTPSGGYWVWVPRGEGTEIQRAWLASEFRREQGLATYTVRWGDNLGMLAERSGIRASRIRELNPSVDFDRLQTGARLTLPFVAAQLLASRPARVEVATSPAPEASKAAGPAAQAAPPATTAPAASARGTRTHVVAAGETLWGIARTHGVSVEALEEANSLTSATIRPGQPLIVPASSPAASSPLAAEDPPEVEHVVASGESLWEIARRYGSTVAAIQEANHLGDRPIQPGQKLIVVAPGRAPEQ